jgi:hypothetical protein
MIWEAFAGRSRLILGLGIKFETGVLPSESEIDFFLLSVNRKRQKRGVANAFNLKMVENVLKLEGLDPTQENVDYFLQLCRLNY